jgi:hypothetical protein
MTKWDCVTIPLTHLPITPDGVVKPKCSSCQTTDCGHRIELTQVSVLGVNRKLKCLVQGGDPCIVVDCKGYT